MKSIALTNGLHLTGAEISELCGNARAILIDVSDKRHPIKKRLMTVGCDGEEKKRLESQILDAERSVVEADAEWQSAVAAYRSLWDAVIEFE